MFVVLITGNIGSGKSEVLNYLKSHGYPIFQSDLWVQKLLRKNEPCYKELKIIFSGKYLLEDSSLDIKQIAKDVFQDKSKLKKMENIVHPYIRKALSDFIEEEKKKKSKIIFVEMPLISSVDFKQFDEVILLDSTDEIKIDRLLKRGMSRKDIEFRLANQEKGLDHIKKSSFFILNNGHIKELYSKIDEIIKTLNSKISN